MSVRCKIFTGNRQHRLSGTFWHNKQTANKQIAASHEWFTYHSPQQQVWNTCRKVKFCGCIKLLFIANLIVLEHNFGYEANIINLSPWDWTNNKVDGPRKLKMQPKEWRKGKWKRKTNPISLDSSEIKAGHKEEGGAFWYPHPWVNSNLFLKEGGPDTLSTPGEKTRYKQHFMKISYQLKL